MLPFGTPFRLAIIPVETAERLIGADLYLHSGQLEPSHFGGKISGYRVHKDGTAIDGRIVFRIVPSLSYKGIRTGRDGWGKEKKFVWLRFEGKEVCMPC